MSGRERIMAGVLGGAIALLGGSKLVSWAVMAPLRSLDNSVAAARAEKENLEKFVERHRDVVQQWEAYTARTFAADAKGAKVALLSHVADLLDRHNLTQERSLSAHAPRKGKNGLTEVTWQVRVEGPLKSIVGFMRDLREEAWLTRLSSVDLRAAGDARERSERRAGRGGDSDVTLNVSMAATTIVLPKVPGTEYQEPAGGVADTPRLALAPEAYDEIADVNFFKKYVPKREIVQGPPPDKNEDNPRPPPPPPPPPPRPDIKVVGVSALNGIPRVYVQDQDHMEEPLGEYFVDDPLDDGQLVLVHPKGIVVRVAKRESNPNDTEDYFYPIGTSFKERVPLEEAGADEVTRALYQEQARARPNSPRPTE